MEKQKTAVDFFNDAIDEILELYPSEWMEIQKVFSQAKQMEKGQIELAFFEGKRDGISSERDSDYDDTNSKKYYESKYGKDENKAENNN